MASFKFNNPAPKIYPLAQQQLRSWEIEDAIQRDFENLAGESSAQVQW